MLHRMNRPAPIEAIEGNWVHSAEMKASRRLPFALAQLGLLPASFGGDRGVDSTRFTPAPSPACARGA
jgi:hypothetical protein